MTEHQASTSCGAFISGGITSMTVAGRFCNMSEGQDGDGGEPRLLQEDPRRVTQILQQGVHHDCAISA